MNSFLIAFIVAFAAAVALTPVIRALALRHGFMDRPEEDPERKVHKTPTALLGGLALFGTVVLILAAYTAVPRALLGGFLLPKHLVGIGVGGLLLMIGGALDDRLRLRPRRQILWPIFSTLVIIASGIGISYIRNPFGGIIQLDGVQWTLFEWRDLPYHLTLFADLFTFVWLMGMMYTTKFLDGLDGLVPGVGAIGAIILFFLSLSKDVAQPETALIAIVFAGACLGFLVWNWHPAKIFLGEGGSLFVGFMLGVLAIISGAKVATTLLIMGIPILDVLWVIARRIWNRTPITKGDRKHLHFRLLDLGLSVRGAVGVLYLITFVFGVSSLFLESRAKMFAFVALLGFMIALAVAMVALYRKRRLP